MTDIHDASRKILEFANTLPNDEQEFQRHHAVQSALALAWLNHIREMWEKTIAANPELKKRVAIAKVLMEQDGHDTDFVCGMPGVEAPICRFGDKSAMCFDYAMTMLYPTPLSAIYANKASEVLDAAEKVTAAAQATAHKGDLWPLRTAGGEVFNSVEEMAKNIKLKAALENIDGDQSSIACR